MNRKFPLPYASLTSCYYGIIGKDCSGILLSRPFIFKKKHRVTVGKNCVWSFSHRGVITPCYSEYSIDDTHRLFSELEVTTDVKGVAHIYNEKLEITHVMKDVFHIFIEASSSKTNILLKKQYKWMPEASIHHLIL